MRKIYLLLLLGFYYGCLTAQLQSPEAFLGYKTGERYTSHWQIVNYFNHVASAMPDRVKLQPYGTTNEGRPLMVAIVSSPENISSLENIRINNLRLAGLAPDKLMASEKMPAIVWLSYNVHGNEPSSSEASLLTIYALSDPKGRAADWLKNTVVIIDPCLNPDGRERYVNWFSGVMGKNANPVMYSREHNEPWPGGRTNHYNFDLNRDWAWQTQSESQQRLKLYQSWMPQVHVDYHEQGINEPYYFAPAAQPYHDVITPWQREFQVAIGKKHAEYFDKEGWLYFTKEIFDLYYPSYGDTYPLYNGAIGMTYEQGGGPRGGLAGITSEGDTLTLYDRVIHHFTTSLSTIEISSANAGRLVKEFRRYFSDAVSSGAGEYKSFVVKYDSAREEQMLAMLRLLDRNGIQYNKGQGSAKGFNYHNGREESFTIGTADIIISTYQPRGAMVKVLFEPRSRLPDSVTYDITAWAIPYAYGLSGYACKDKLAITGSYAAMDRTVNAPGDDLYGYIIKWQGVKAVKVLSQLLKAGIKVRFAEEPFELNGKVFDRGSLILVKTSNQSAGSLLWEKLVSICNDNNVLLHPVTTGMVDKGADFGSSKVRPVKAPSVVLLTGEGVNRNAAGEVWHFFEQEIDYPLTLVNADDAGSVDWKKVDILIMPDGRYDFLKDKRSLEQLKDWISNGGKLIAIENAVAEIAGLDWGIRFKKTEEDKKEDELKDPYEPLKKYASRERDMIQLITPGSIYKVDLDNSHPLAYGYPDYYYTLKMDDKIYEYFKEDGWNVGIVKKTNQVAGFVGSKLKDKLKDGLLFGSLGMGKGSLVLLADDPLFRSFWENGKLLFSNSVFMVY